MPAQRTVEMVIEDETKGAYRFLGQDEDSPASPDYLVGTIYLRKRGLATLGVKERPSRIKVTVEIP